MSEQIISPTLAALRRAGTPYRGLLYAGLMITEDGPKVLEFNCRFGDPETQAVIRLLRSDLFEVMSACAVGSLATVDVEWLPAAAAAVVMASSDYPYGSSDPAAISGLDAAAGIGAAGLDAAAGSEETPGGRAAAALRDAAGEDCVIFQAGTGLIDGVLHATGGRVLAVTALGPDLAAAADRARRGVAAIAFRGARHRADIGPAGGGIPA